MIVPFDNSVEASRAKRAVGRRPDAPAVVWTCDAQSVGEQAETPYERQFEGERLEGVDARLGYRFIKRAFDIVFSAAVLVLFCWLYAIIAILVKIDDPRGPVIFAQERVGKNGRIFKMHKFRSMVVDAEEHLDELQCLNEKTGPVFKIKDDPRVTRVGKWLRKLSLDELPQFWDVLKGDISIVGPRPALPKEVAKYDDYQRQRLLVKPGITCYWQTRMNRDSITFDEWVDLDLWRVPECSEVHRRGSCLPHRLT